MATEKRMIDAYLSGEVPKIKTHFAEIIVRGETEKPCYNIIFIDPQTREYEVCFGSYSLENVRKWLSEEFEIVDAPTVDAVPVDDIRLHHILIDNEGVPEVKLQIGDRYILLRGDPLDVREVVHGRWKYYHKQNIAVCTNCSFERDLDANFGKAVSCPNCGANMMDGDGNA